MGEEELCLENPCRGSWGCGRGSIAKAVAEGLNYFLLILKEKKKTHLKMFFGGFISLCFVYTVILYGFYHGKSPIRTKTTIWGNMF